MQGEIYIDANRHTVAEALQLAGADGLRITSKTRVRLHFGESTIYVHQGTRPRLVLPAGNMERHVFAYLGLSGVMHALLLMLIFLTPPGSRSLDLDAFNIDDRLASIINLEEEPEPEELPEMQADDEEELAATERDDEGRAGEEETEDEDNRMAIEGEDDRVELSMELAREEAADRGALEVLNQFDISSIFGGPTQMGYDPVSAAGGRYGDAIGSAFGYGGLGFAGAGVSGGGTNPGGFGMGPISTRGRHGGGDDDLGRDLSNMRERSTREVEVELGRATVDGHLDREIIARVIRENRRQIRDCYQREYQRDQTIAGRIVVRFVIDSNGRVADVRIHETDMNNSAVEDCIVRRFGRLNFPAPSTPGLVRVNYPFVFTPG
jgi:TonB family protein